jgi:hypothetical protein
MPPPPTSSHTFPVPYLHICLWRYTHSIWLNRESPLLRTPGCILERKRIGFQVCSDHSRSCPPRTHKIMRIVQISFNPYAGAHVKWIRRPRSRRAHLTARNGRSHSGAQGERNDESTSCIYDGGLSDGSRIRIQSHGEPRAHNCTSTIPSQHQHDVVWSRASTACGGRERGTSLLKQECGRV